MTAFTEDEQWHNDLDWFAVDKDGRIGHFANVGHRLLPPGIGKSREDLSLLVSYFEAIEPSNGFSLCPHLQSQLKLIKINNFAAYIKSFSEMSKRGLFSYDSFDWTHKERPFYRVT